MQSKSHVFYLSILSILVIFATVSTADDEQTRDTRDQGYEIVEVHGGSISEGHQRINQRSGRSDDH